MGDIGKIPSKNVLRSQAHEFLTAAVIAQVGGGNTVFGSSELQVHKKGKYERLAMFLKSEHPDEYRHILASVRSAVSKLPAPGVGEVLFVEKDANDGEVWDVKYPDMFGEWVYVSCKLSSMEDKAYRLNTEGYVLPLVQKYLREVFTEEGVLLTGEDGHVLSYQEVLHRRGSGVLAVQRQIVGILGRILSSPGKYPEDYAVFTKLMLERVIGKGGFWKINHDGSAVLYPSRVGSELFIDTQSVTLRERSVGFVAELKNRETGDSTCYEVNFRIKLKDGVAKKVTMNSHGVGNWAATVKVSLV